MFSIVTDSFKLYQKTKLHKNTQTNEEFFNPTFRTVFFIFQMPKLWSFLKIYSNNKL